MHVPPWRLVLALTTFLLPTTVSVALPNQPTPATAPVVTAIDYNEFERPQLVQALLEQDLHTLLRFRAGLLVEDHGIPQGLVVYLKAFENELGQLFLCPTLIPAGVDAELDRLLSRRSLDPGSLASVGVDVLRMLGGMFQTPDSTRGAWPGDPRVLMEPIINGRAILAQLQSEGQRDARLFAVQAGCDGPPAQALSAGMRRLIRHLRSMP